MITRCLFVLGALLVYPSEFCRGFTLFQGSYYLQSQNTPVQRSFALKFMSAVTDLPLQSINNISTATATELTYVIKEAKMQDFASIVSLRVNVFYPEGSINIVALKNLADEESAEDQSARYMGNLIGAIEISPSDFLNTCMENIGAQRKLYLADLCIRQDARRIGVATSLLKFVERFALDNKYAEIYLHVEVDNAVAKNLYVKNGYLEVARSSWSRAFTMERLSKPPDTYVMLWKQLGSSPSSPSPSSSSSSLPE